MEGERAMAANIGKGVSNGGSSAGATVHFSLQGKGGVGKSVVASWLAQYFRSKDLFVTCIDTDPVNATLTQFKDLNAEHLNVLKAGGINEKQFDALVERVCSREGIYIVDTGATTFVPLWHYMLEHQLFHFLMEQGRRVFVHLVVTGGQGMQDTLAGFKRVAETAPDKSIVVWLNEYFGEVERDGKRFEDLQLAQQFAAQLAGAVLIRERNRNTFGDDIKLMLQGFLTFDAAIRSEQFGLVSKQRLTIVRRGFVRPARQSGSDVVSGRRLTPPDVMALIGEVAARHGITLRPDDPVFALVTVNQLVLEQTMTELIGRTQQLTNEFDQAAARLQARAGSVLATESSKGRRRDPSGLASGHHLYGHSTPPVRGGDPASPVRAGFLLVAVCGTDWGASVVCYRNSGWSRVAVISGSR
jgi:hypothetical protein